MQGMLMIPISWFLIAYLSTGGIASVTKVNGPIDCAARASFEMRYDPRVTHTYCLFTSEETEA